MKIQISNGVGLSIRHKDYKLTECCNCGVSEGWINVSEKTKFVHISGWIYSVVKF